ncbi:hypothetical protein ACIA5D_28810 [Actinoplanes sp. NPDC051513]|uniref:hypothetical protein n=1 Tax=Actinoplanes sp. NPDC051513 TaxID=3363908 RepID=UPI00378A2117
MPDNHSLGVHSEAGRLRKVLVCAPCARGAEVPRCTWTPSSRSLIRDAVDF